MACPEQNPALVGLALLLTLGGLPLCWVAAWGLSKWISSTGERAIRKRFGKEAHDGG